jgi:hypothetical protein
MRCIVRKPSHGIWQLFYQHRCCYIYSSGKTLALMSAFETKLKHRGDSNFTIRSPRWRIQLAIIVATASSTFLILGALGKLAHVNRRDHTSASIITLIGFGYVFFSSGRYLRFLDDGFEFKERLTPCRHIRWSDVDQIGIASFPCSAGGKLSYTRYVGIRFMNDTVNAAKKESQKNREACGYDFLLSSGFGMSLERLTAILVKRHKQKTARARGAEPRRSGR